VEKKMIAPMQPLRKCNRYPTAAMLLSLVLLAQAALVSTYHDICSMRGTGHPAVFFKAMQAHNRKLGLDAGDFNRMTFEELYDFMLIWYAAGGNKQVNNIVIAVEKYGLGKGIDRFEDARAGDFMDISRTNGTGHTIIFQNWIRNGDGQITGIRYWSSQESGVGYNVEYFDTSGQGIVCSNQVYIARVLPVRQFKSFR
jgi:hypothetical protein